jgi:hypothetical protein
VLHLSVYKNAFIPYCWKRCCVIFLLVWHVSPVLIRFVTDVPFFFTFYSLSSLWNYNLTLLVVGISTSILIFFISNFYLGCFVEVLYVFDFILQSQFTKYYVFQFGLYFLDFYFFPWSFCKSFIGFQFHHSIQINDIMFFNLILIVLISNFFLVLFCKIYYSFQFYPLIMSHPRERSMAILDWFRGLLFYCE